jgi:hypothetical protein
MRRTAPSPLGSLIRPRPPAALLCLCLLAPACATSPSVSTGDRVLLTAAEAAVVLADASEIVFWEVPRFVVWTAPKAVLYDLPRAGVMAVAGRRVRVEDAQCRLKDPDLTVEEERVICDELASLTGIPLRSREGWLRWWEGASSRGEEDWLGDFVKEQIALLESPDYFRRVAAIERLTKLYGTDLGYDPKLAPAELEGGAERWRAHLASAALP